ncbi:hypothetical protein V2O64_11750 [Verrucomicrobiaceae bacterium 227]
MTVKKLLLPALAALLPSQSHGQATAKWIAGSGEYSWTDASNWDQDAFPGSVDSEIGTTVNLAAPHGSELEVSLDATLPTVLRDLRFDAGQVPSRLSVNLGAESNINATSIGNSLLTINEGGPNGAESFAELNIAGELTIGQIRLSRDADGPTSSLNLLPGGFLNMTGGGHFVMRTDAESGTSIFNMTGGTFTSGGNRNLEMGSQNSQVHFSGDADFDGKELTLAADIVNPAHTDKTSLITVTGDTSSINFKAIRGWVAGTNTSGASTFQFTPGVRGISAIASLGDVDLAGSSGAGDRPGKLIVDLTSYESTDDLVLFDLTAGSGSILGEFAEVTIVGGNGTLDYNYNSSQQIALTSITLGPKSGGVNFTNLVPTGNDLILNWNDGTPAAYTIESSLDLSSESWEILTTEAANGTFTATDILASDPRRFFRLRLNP